MLPLVCWYALVPGMVGLRIDATSPSLGDFSVLKQWGLTFQSKRMIFKHFKKNIDNIRGIHCFTSSFRKVPLQSILEVSLILFFKTHLHRLVFF